MTDTGTHTTFASPRLERPRDSAFKGVCAAVARTTGTDPVLWRVLAVVTTFFGGLGVFLYLAGVFAIPREGEERSTAERLVHGPDRRLSGGQIVLVVLVVVAFGGLLADGDGLLAAIVLGVLGLMWLRRQDEGRPAAPAPAVAAPAPPATGTTDVPVWVPPPPRPRSPLVGITASLAALVAGALLLLAATGDHGITAEVVLASTLAVVGAGLVIGSFWGRSGWLVAVALVLGVALAATAGARPVIDHGVGDREWHPTGSGSFRLGVGEAVLDLRDVQVRESGTVAVDARVEVGHLLVLVPDDVRISLDARARLGSIDLLGEETNGSRPSDHLELGGPGAPQVRVDLSVRTGQVEVRRG